MKEYKHLFFDMDNTITPARQRITEEMRDYLDGCTQDIVIVSGSTNENISHQTNNLRAFYLGQNGNHAIDPKGVELWNETLSEDERQQILTHIDALIELLPEIPNSKWHPVEDRGAQITFSPIGNTAPVELKQSYDPDRKKRFALLDAVPFISETLTVKIGGSTSLDYFKRENNKGSNVQRLITTCGWKNDDCIYFGDGLFPGGNDEAVIGVIETVAVTDDIDCLKKLREVA